MLFAYAVTPQKPVVSREYPYEGLVNELSGLEENKVCVAVYIEDAGIAGIDVVLLSGASIIV